MLDTFASFFGYRNLPIPNIGVATLIQQSPADLLFKIEPSKCAQQAIDKLPRWQIQKLPQLTWQEQSHLFPCWTYRANMRPSGKKSWLRWQRCWTTGSSSLAS